MKDPSRTNQELLEKNAFLQRRITELEALESKRKRSEEALLEIQNRFYNLFERMSSGVAIYEAVDDGTDFILRNFNRAAEGMEKIRREELLGRRVTEVFPGVRDFGLLAVFQRVWRTGDPEDHDISFYRDNRIAGWRENHVYKLPSGEIVAIYNDVTVRKRAEEALRKSEEQYRALVENASDIVFRTDDTGHFTFVNPAALRITGYEEKEIIGMHYLTFIRPDKREEVRKFFGLQFVKRISNTYCEYPIIVKDGHEIWLGENTQLILEDGKVAAFQSVARDITDRKRIEEALRESEEKYRNILENIEEGYYEVDLAGNFTFFNSSLCRILGYPKEEMAGLNSKVYMDAANAKKVFRAFNEVYVTGIPIKGLESEIIRKDGTRAYNEDSVSLIARPGEKPTGFRGITRDVTERKRSEGALKESEHKYRLVVENAAEAILIAQDGMLKYVNPVTLSILGYSEGELISKPFIEIIHPEEREKVLAAHTNRMQDRESQPVRQFRVICKDGSIKWADSNAVVISWKGQPATLNFLTDVTERKKAEEALGKSFARLRTALEATVKAIAVTVETRDPYTAGHQRRVADLSQAIAREMHLTADQTDGMNMAGLIHDLGKIAVPAEILSKPVRLTEMEFELIKTHAQAGYEILKDIEFPWPIARMILEHHERMDGSGYPNGLAGDKLLLESRILSVADVVEVMASHRPYRPAIGVEAALEEIENNKGILYDGTVADACLRLFREKGFNLQGYDFKR